MNPLLAKLRERRMVLALALGMALAFPLCSSWGLPADSGAVASARQAFNAGNYAGAIKTLESATSGGSANAEDYYWLGRSYYEMHDDDDAVKNAEKSVSMDPKSSLYHQWLGRAYGAKADRDHSFFQARKVKKEFEQAVQLDPSNLEARRDLEQFCMDAPGIVGGNKDESMTQVNAIAAADPLQGHLARAAYDLDALKKPDEAEAEYKQALDAKPHNMDAYFEAADFYVGQKKTSDLQNTIQAAAAVSSSDPRLAYFRGVAGVLSGADLGSAEQELKSYLASTPDRSDWPTHAGARTWLGKLYEAQGKRADAAEQYRAALQLDPQDKEAHNRLQNLGKTSP